MIPLQEFAAANASYSTDHKAALSSKTTTMVWLKMWCDRHLHRSWTPGEPKREIYPRDCLISRMCDHILRQCVFPFPRQPHGLLLWIIAFCSLRLFVEAMQVSSWSLSQCCWTAFIDNFGDTIIRSNEACCPEDVTGNSYLSFVVTLLHT